MTLKPGDIVTIDGIELEVTNAATDGYWFQERNGGANYYSHVFHTKEDLEKLLKEKRFIHGADPKIRPGNKECRFHSWGKYVGAREIYDVCDRCDAKRVRDWRLIKDEREY